jgi:hypothetical protein
MISAYADVHAVMLAIDGRQPDKGPETLSVVRELERKRVWCAAALLSSAPAEIPQLLAQARRWAERLDKPVRLGRSEKHEALVRGIAAEFPGVPHHYCANHCWRAVAKPVLDADSHAQVQRRRTTRGGRTIEREIVAAQRAPERAARAAARRENARATTGPADEKAQHVVLEYCAAVRGLLNDDHGGPLHPPGLRMAEALEDVHAALQRNLEAKQGGRRTRDSRVERGTLTGGWQRSTTPKQPFGPMWRLSRRFRRRSNQTRGRVPSVWRSVRSCRGSAKRAMSRFGTTWAASWPAVPLGCWEEGKRPSSRGTISLSSAGCNSPKGTSAACTAASTPEYVSCRKVPHYCWPSTRIWHTQSR